MENENERNIEFEEIEVPTEMEETSGNSGTVQFLAGVIGGFVAYGMIAVAKKLKKTLDEKKAAKNAEVAAKADGNEVIDIEEVKFEKADEKPGK